MASLKNKRVLVVGGAGFVGSNLCLNLLKNDVAHVEVVDNLMSADISNVPVDERLHFTHGSAADDRILSSVGVDYDYVFHLATYHGNQSSMLDPIADHDNNTLPMLKLAEHFKGVKKLEKFVYSSAGCTVAQKTFDDAAATTEEDPVSLYLDSPYQISKIIGEFHGNYYFMRHNFPLVKARFQNVYGPREILGAGLWRKGPATVWRNVTPTFLWKSLHGEALPVEKGGVATRDFIYVDDIVAGLISCALRGKAGEAYNLASGDETSILTLAETMNELTANKAGIDMKSAREWDRSGKRYGSTEKARQELDFQAQVPLKVGLEKTVAWTKENMVNIKRIMQNHVYYMPELTKYL
ncbi:MAG: NAD-dependent epimerase/dehydratase family protein [Francisellaceae bacterium]|nr:NAD-dependent epimerase/dehydratase family protein [Francisellaceae bacterium]